MGKKFCALLKKDLRMMISGKYFFMAAGFLVLYTLYVNLGYVRFMKEDPYHVYLYDPQGLEEDVASEIIRVSSKEELEDALQSDGGSAGVDLSSGKVQVILYEGTPKSDRYRAAYALSRRQSSHGYRAEVVGDHTLEQKARREITCELLFFEISAVGFLGIAAILFKEKNMGVIRVHGILPLPKGLFLFSKMIIFLLADLAFAVLLTLFNTGWVQGLRVLPGVLIQTIFLSLVMALVGIGCSLLLKDFRQFTLAYLVIAIFAVTPVFLTANTPVKLEGIAYHPFYPIYRGLKNAYFGNWAADPLYFVGVTCGIVVLFAGVWLAFCKEMAKEG